MGFSEHWIESADGIRLYCRRYGDAANPRILLCLPGLTRNCKDFESPAEHLSAHWQVLTPDLRGRGHSGWDPQPKRYALPAYLSDAWRVLDRFSQNPAVLLGTSLGGLVALTMAAQRPERVLGVALNDIGPELPLAAGRRIAGYVGRSEPVSDWAAAQRLVRSQYEVAFPAESGSFWETFTRLSWREDDAGRPVPDIDPAVITTLRKNYLRGRILQGLRQCLFMKRRPVPFDAWPVFERCQKPMLLIRGNESDVVPTALVRRMLRVKPGLKVVDIPGRGHAPTLEEPAAVRALNRFLDDLPV